MGTELIRAHNSSKWALVYLKYGGGYNGLLF